MIYDYKELKYREQLSYIVIVSQILILMVNYFRFLSLRIPSPLLISMASFTLVSIVYNVFNMITKSGIPVAIITLGNITYQIYFWGGNLILGTLLTIFVIQLTIIYHRLVYKILSSIDKLKKPNK